MRWSCAGLWLGSYCSICVSKHDVPLDITWSKCSTTPSSDWYLSSTKNLQVTPVDLHRHLYLLGVGTIEDVRVQRDKGFGFERYNAHVEAALAIQMGNARIVMFCFFWFFMPKNRFEPNRDLRDTMRFVVFKWSFVFLFSIWLNC